MENQVIKVLNKEHGKKVIQYWKDRGVDTRDHKGVINEKDCDTSIYYGVINDKYNNYSLKEVQYKNAEIIELPNEEEIFKAGDKVYHFTHGWGIIEVLDSFVTVSFDGEIIHFNHNNQLLSFTEYTLQGFSQERPIELPEVGELCLFYDDEEDLEYGDLFCGKFQSYRKNEKRPYRRASDNSSWSHCKRIKILD